MALRVFFFNFAISFSLATLVAAGFGTATFIFVESKVLNDVCFIVNFFFKVRYPPVFSIPGKKQGATLL